MTEKLTPRNWADLGKLFTELPSTGLAEHPDTRGEMHGVGLFFDAVGDQALEQGMTPEIASVVALGAVRGILAYRKLTELSAPASE